MRLLRLVSSVTQKNGEKVIYTTVPVVTVTNTPGH